MEDRRIPIEDVEEIVIEEYEARLVDENKVCVEVITDGIYKEG